MSKLYIGISGYKGSGKDELKGLLIDFLKSVSVDVKEYSFADPIKDVGDLLNGWDERHREGELKEVVDPELGFSPRQFYQWLGTDFGRHYCGQDYWVSRAAKRAPEAEVVLVSDVRFQNEVDYITNSGGFCVGIKRPETENNTDAHESEAFVKDIREQCLIVVDNSGTLEKLREAGDFVASQIYGRLKSLEASS